MTAETLLIYLIAAAVGAILGLLLLALSRRGRVATIKPRERRAETPANYIVIDGSNVMYWRGERPTLGPVLEVISTLASRGFTPGVVFDANAGHLLTGRYLHHHHFGQLLSLPVDRVLVVPKGTQADSFILSSARNLKARIVTNDRYRDWAHEHPEVAEKGYLIQGGYRESRLWLAL